MKTKYLRLGLLGVLVFLITGLFTAATLPSHNPQETPAPITSDAYSACSNPGRFSAEDVNRDLYRNIYLGYCTERGMQEAVSAPTLVQIIYTWVVTRIPEVTITATPTRKPRNNPKPTSTEVPTDETPEVTETPKPTDQPTDVPTATPTPKLTKTPKPTSTESCHANSGRGDGSEDCDGDGVDDDPGNSEGHNNGGD